MSLTPERLALRGTHPEFGPVTLAQLLATWTVHDMNHVGQIVQTLAKQYRDAIGPWRRFVPIVDRSSGTRRAILPHPAPAEPPTRPVVG